MEKETNMKTTPIPRSGIESLWPRQHAFGFKWVTRDQEGSHGVSQRGRSFGVGQEFGQELRLKPFP